MTVRVYPDDAGLAARYSDGEIPPREMRRRVPGDPSCPACTDSPTGFCKDHPEFWSARLLDGVR
jgi:hypothetical protein